MTATVVCRFDELAPGTARRVEIDGVPVALVRIHDDVYAIGDVCSHANVSPVPAARCGATSARFKCPAHRSTFELTTGETVTLPATTPVPVF